MIPARGWLVIAVWLMFGLICWISGPAKAAESPSPPIGTYSCADIRAAIALFSSVEAAVKAARAAGASDRKIEEARRCLSS
jgi:hypothetical protein